ncbi:putative lumazine-binding protein [compost metagenome]
MKRIVSTLFFACIISIVASAASKPSPMRDWKVSKVVDAYVKSVSEGESQLVEHFFANDFEYYLNDRKERYSKKEIVRFLKSMTGHTYDCVTDYSILDENSTTCLAKMTMHFQTFIRTDYIYLSSTDEGWKVCKILVGHSQKENQQV